MKKIWKAFVKAVKLALAFIALLVIVSMTVTYIKARRNAAHINEMAARLHVGMNASEVAAVFPEDYFTGWIRPLECKGPGMSIYSPEEEADLKVVAKSEVPCETLVSAKLRRKSEGKILLNVQVPGKPDELRTLSREEFATFLDTNFSGRMYAVSFTYLTPTPMHVTFRLWFGNDGKVSKVVTTFGWD